MTDLEQARAAKRVLRAELGDRRGVCGIGVARTQDGYGLQVNVTEPAARTAVPSSVDGVDVRVRVTGPVSAQS